jgi:hypothetical protein
MDANLFHMRYNNNTYNKGALIMKKIQQTAIIALSIMLLICCLPPVATMAAASGNYQYTVKNNEATITKYVGKERDIVIPDTLDGYRVTAIGVLSLQGHCLRIIPI